MDSIKNFVQLTDRIGTSGQPTEKQFKIISGADYSVVINLAMPDHPESISTEGSIVTQLGMDYIHIPVPFDEPKPRHVKHFCEIMRLYEKQRVHVHCIMNYRVSAFMYHYLQKVVGLEEKHSRSAMFAEWKPDDVWVSLLQWNAHDIGL